MASIISSSQTKYSSARCPLPPLIFLDTPDHGGYEISNNIFIGDSIFNPDISNGRYDSPTGDGFLSFPPEAKFFTGYDYPLPYLAVGQQERKDEYGKNDSTHDDC
ncbi:hypothetical protein N7457_004107 [Penicillium paradoxum]|uniref:uncharacterized protein n=1 Tax=Penicillium paradoxum TaxID=176176 RepID=UPI002549410C|nr:uncharacterized protein N7457_004107 [Penicillium paradoxum]KAJ5782333.1 hypothetical protein N7457_004107 [Penicillium paradoxum]